MPRRRRLILPNVPLHIIHRGNNRQVCFVAVDDYRRYLYWLREYAELTGCRVHAYVLMTNHVHLLVTPEREQSPSELMKALGQRYAQYFNRTYQRTGPFWDGRYRSCVAQAEEYLLICQRYIELNPVRAGMVKHPAQYRWSSYRANALGARNIILTPHELYLRLHKLPEERLMVYQSLFRGHLQPAVVRQLRAATNGNFALGTPTFTEQIAAALGRRVVPTPPGRPRADIPELEEA